MKLFSKLVLSVEVDETPLTAEPRSGSKMTLSSIYCSTLILNLL